MHSNRKAFQRFNLSPGHREKWMSYIWIIKRVSKRCTSFWKGSTHGPSSSYSDQLHRVCLLASEYMWLNTYLNTFPNTYDFNSVGLQHVYTCNMWLVWSLLNESCVRFPNHEYAIFFFLQNVNLLFHFLVCIIWWILMSEQGSWL